MLQLRPYVPEQSAVIEFIPLLHHYPVMLYRLWKLRYWVLLAAASHPNFYMLCGPRALLAMPMRTRRKHSCYDIIAKHDMLCRKKKLHKAHFVALPWNIPLTAPLAVGVKHVWQRLLQTSRRAQPGQHTQSNHGAGSQWLAAARSCKDVM